MGTKRKQGHDIEHPKEGLIPEDDRAPTMGKIVSHEVILC